VKSGVVDTLGIPRSLVFSRQVGPRSHASRGGVGAVVPSPLSAVAAPCSGRSRLEADPLLVRGHRDRRAQHGQVACFDVSGWLQGLSRRQIEHEKGTADHEEATAECEKATAECEKATAEHEKATAEHGKATEWRQKATRRVEKASQ
jgi:hypothetical protein